MEQNNNGNQTIIQENNQHSNSHKEVGEPVDVVLLTKTYKMEVKIILNDYLRQTQDKSFIAINDIDRTKRLFLALKMPNEFKELHLNLVLAMDKMKDYLIDGDEGKLQESDKLINKMKREYEWLN